MTSKTPFQEVADSYASEDRDAMAVLRNMDDESLKELDRVLHRISNSVEVVLEE